MKKHELKILPQYFQPVWDGTKTFELRKDDRDYQRGDILVLREWDGEKYTGSALCVKVTYILQDADKYGLKNGYVIMGIRRIESNDDFKPQTNASRLRQMTDDELAEEIVKCRDADDFRKTVLGMRMNTTEEWLDWLKSPVGVGK